MKKRFIYTLVLLLIIPSYISAQSFTGDLYFGAKGVEVKRLQSLLGVRQTGYFGNETKAALKSWQTKNKIRPTGNFGPLSRALANKNGMQAGIGIVLGSEIKADDRQYIASSKTDLAISYRKILLDIQAKHPLFLGAKITAEGEKVKALEKIQELRDKRTARSKYTDRTLQDLSTEYQNIVIGYDTAQNWLLMASQEITIELNRIPTYTTAEQISRSYRLLNTYRIALSNTNQTYDRIQISSVKAAGLLADIENGTGSKSTISSRITEISTFAKTLNFNCLVGSAVMASQC